MNVYSLEKDEKWNRKLIVPLTPQATTAPLLHLNIDSLT